MEVIKVRTFKLIIWMITALPLLFTVSLLGSLFYSMCVFYGEREIIEPMVDRVGEKIKQQLINFVEGKKNGE